MLLLDKTYQQNMKSSYMWIIDCGHGGIDSKGNYTTAPAKMHKFPDGLTIFEGVINRGIGKLLYMKLQSADIDFALVYEDVEDTSLSERVRIADSIFMKDSRAIYLSIHSNAGGGSGFEIFTSPGRTKSDRIAGIFEEVYKKSFPNFPFRGLKEEDFYVLRKTDCPSILVENLFFDKRSEAEYLLSPEGQSNIAECLYQCIISCEKLKPI